ncbi:MAG: HAD-IIIA family hydrolase [Candidatus Competibacteraceae bacterium]
MNAIPSHIVDKAARVRLVIFDVDGVLTDGRLYYGDDGNEYKSFYSRDGHGIKMLQSHGVDIAVLSGRASIATARRMAELNVRHVYLGVEDKLSVFGAFLERLGLRTEQVAYVGDDVIDLPVMAQVGLAVAVADADPFVERHADWRTPNPGGHGAVRDVCELILYAQGHLSTVQAQYWPKRDDNSTNALED